MHTIPDQVLTPSQITQLTLAMLEVAAVDGMHPAEAALIGQFYEGSRTEDMPSTAAFMTNAEVQVLDAAALKGSSPDFADTVVLMCLMTAHADGNFSSAERDHVQALAAQMGVDAPRFDAHLEHVRDDLIGALSHLPDAGSVAAVAKEISQTK